MTEDRLSEALRTLREDVHGRTENPEQGLARVLSTTRQRRRRRSLRWRIGIPVVALLAGSSAWASMTGGWATLRAQVVELFRLEQDPPGHEASSGLAGREASRALPTPFEASGEQVEDPPEEEPSSPREVPDGVAPASDAGEARAPQPSRPSNEGASRGEDGVAPSTAQPLKAAQENMPLPARDPAESEKPTANRLALEKAHFETAFRLHSGGGTPKAAVAAWDNYLKLHPDGRFVPEARYARAVALARAGQVESARQALRAFAEAPAGSYRQDDARRLLDHLAQE